MKQNQQQLNELNERNWTTKWKIMITASLLEIIERNVTLYGHFPLDKDAKSEDMELDWE